MAPPVDVLLHLHRLMDADDTHLELAVAAVNHDCSDPTLQGVYPAMRAAELLRTPAAARDYLLAQLSLRATSPFLRCLRLGLLPFGAWAVAAACSVHSPRVTPETRRMMGAVQDQSPWVGVRSLGTLMLTLRRNMSIIRDLGAQFDGTVVLTPLTALLASITPCGGHSVWAALQAQCATVMYGWGCGDITAAAGLDLVLAAMEAVCLSEGAGSPTQSPPPSPTVSSLTSEGSATMLSLLKHFFGGLFQGRELGLISSAPPCPSPVISGSSVTPPLGDIPAGVGANRQPETPKLNLAGIDRPSGTPVAAARGAVGISPARAPKVALNPPSAPMTAWTLPVPMSVYIGGVIEEPPSAVPFKYPPPRDPVGPSVYVGGVLPDLPEWGSTWGASVAGITDARPGVARVHSTRKKVPQCDWVTPRAFRGDDATPAAPQASRKVQQRSCHNACIRDMHTLHRRTGITNPDTVKILQLSSSGVKIPTNQQRRYATASSAKAASRRTAIRTSSIHCDPNPMPGVSASLDLTHIS
jgi:hypothetical protein